MPKQEKILILFLIFFSVIIGFNIDFKGENKEEYKEPIKTENKITITDEDIADFNKQIDTTIKTPPRDYSEWRYYDNEDPMTSKKIYHAFVMSKDYFELDRPYEGRQSAELTLRTHPRWGKDLMLSIKQGQFLCRYNGCNLTVRFDDGNPITFSASEPEDNSTTILFIDNYSRFVGLMLKSKTVKIQANFYQNGSRVFEFNVAGFDVKAYRPN